MKKIYEDIRQRFKGESLDDFYFTAVVLVGATVLLFSMWEWSLAQMTFESYESSIYKAKWFLYLYPVGFIVTSYLASIQLKNATMYGDEKEEKKYRFLAGLSFIPFLNIMYLVPLIIFFPIVLPLAYLVSNIVNIIISIKDYILDGYRKALERISNQNL